MKLGDLVFHIKRTCQLNGEIEEKNGEDAQAVDILKTPQDTPQHVEH